LSNQTQNGEKIDSNSSSLERLNELLSAQTLGGERINFSFFLAQTIIHGMSENHYHLSNQMDT